MAGRFRHLTNEAFTVIRKHFQHIMVAALMILLVLIVYWRDVEILANEAFQNEAFNHILLIPFFAGVLFYLKRDMVKAALSVKKYRKSTPAQYLDELIGVILCLIAFLFYWYGSYTFYPLEYHLLSLPIFVMGITLILFNSKVLKVLFFSILFLLFLVPPPTEFTYTIGGYMGNFNTQASYTLLRIGGLPVSLNSTYGSPTIYVNTTSGVPVPFTVDIACSGIYTVMAFAMFAVFLAFIAPASVFKKLLILVLGFFLFEILNVVRITSIIFVGYQFGEEVAMLIFHAVAGLLLIFVGMLLTLFISEKFLKIQVIPTSRELPSCSECETSFRKFENFCSHCGKFVNKLTSKVSQKFWAKLFLLLLGVSVAAVSINAPTFAIAQGPTGVTSSSGWENATNVFPQVTNYQLLYLGRDTAYEKLAGQDASVSYAYFPENFSQSTIYVDLGVASTVSNLHSWEVCLITWQTSMGLNPLVSVLVSKDIQLLENVPLIARYLAFTHPYNYTQVTLYWFERATFRLGATVEQKYARISLIILTHNYNATTSQQFENELTTFGQLIAAYWEPLKSQSLISLGVPAQQLLLTASVVFVAFTKSVEYTNERRKRINNLKIFDKLASAKEKRVLQTFMDLAKQKRNIETGEIADAIEKRIEKSVKTSEIIGILNRLEEYGFIDKKIVSLQNRPRLVWKISGLGI